jgi:hypothetical protein
MRRKSTFSKRVATPIQYGTSPLLLINGHSNRFVMSLEE